MDEVDKLGERLSRFFNWYRDLICMQTLDTSRYGICYNSGLLRKETDRDFVNVGRKEKVSGQEGSIIRNPKNSHSPT